MPPDEPRPTLPDLWVARVETATGERAYRTWAGEAADAEDAREKTYQALGPRERWHIYELSGPFATVAETDRLRAENERLSKDHATLTRLMRDIQDYALTPGPVLRSIAQAQLLVAERAQGAYDDLEPTP